MTETELPSGLIKYFLSINLSIIHPSRLSLPPSLPPCLPGGLWPGARVQGADPGGGGGPGRAVRQPGDVQPQRQWAGDGGDGQHPQHTQTQTEVRSGSSRHSPNTAAATGVFLYLTHLWQIPAHGGLQRPVAAPSVDGSCLLHSQKLALLEADRNSTCSVEIISIF